MLVTLCKVSELYTFASLARMVFMRKKKKKHEKSKCVTYRDKEVTKHMLSARDEDRKLKQEIFWSHGLKLEVNISHARTEVSPAFSN